MRVCKHCGGEALPVEAGRGMTCRVCYNQGRRKGDGNKRAVMLQEKRDRAQREKWSEREREQRVNELLRRAWR